MSETSYGPMQLAKKLQMLLDKRGLTQALLSRRSGVAQSAISEVISGKRQFKLAQGLAIARELNVSLDFLADDEIDEVPANQPMPEWHQLVIRLANELGEKEAMRRLLAKPPTIELGGAEYVPEQPETGLRRRSGA